jgi:hypothetical protein
MVPHSSAGQGQVRDSADKEDEAVHLHAAATAWPEAGTGQRRGSQPDPGTGTGSRATEKR